MTTNSDPLAYVLQSASRSEVRYRLHVTQLEPSFLQAQRIGRHIASMAEALTPIRIGVVHSYTSDLLDPWLWFEAALQGLQPEMYHAPYGFLDQAAQPLSDLAAYAPEMTLLLLQWEDLHPALKRPLGCLERSSRVGMAAEVVERLTGLLSRFRENVSGQLVVTVLPAMSGPGLGEYDAQAEASEVEWRAGVKSRLGEFIRDRLSGVTLLDLDESVAALGRRQFFDPRLWYSARFPFSTRGAREVSRRFMSLGAVLKLSRAKVIALDADNTLWGGVIGEDGIHGIALGPDYPGNCYVAFQRRILDYQQRGFVLALCSKNNPDDVMQVLREHPHQILREEHFAAIRVDWCPKPQNLRSLADELNLGLDSFVFVDDSDHECLAVRSELPEVEVIRTPAKPADIAMCLDSVARLQVLRLTEEDRQKTGLYVQERRRRQLAAASNDIGDYLLTLNMRMRVALNDRTALGRLSQLTQKTNQFNLTTRRYTEPEMQRLIDADDWLVAHFSLCDIFGDSGIVGLALVHVDDDRTADLDTFLMSCRVIGRTAESAFLDTVLRILVSRGVRSMRARFLATSKNQLAQSFLPDNGFRSLGDGEYEKELTADACVGQASPAIEVEVA